VAKSAPRQKRLKLYTEQPPKPVRPVVETIASLPGLLHSFQAATHQPLRYVSPSELDARSNPPWSVPVYDLRREIAGYLALDRESSGPTVGGDDAAQSLAASLADLLSELVQARHALRQREAELAAGIPVAIHPEEERHLASRLESVLRSAAEAVGGVAAGLYLLDDATTQLKLRSVWGLPFDRFTAPARPLQGAVGDLEALLGHAVVLNDKKVMATWNPPEDYPTAVCVPVSSPTTVLGTLWVFCGETREPSDAETNVLEIIAGRLAADLEREMLLSVGISGAALQKQIAAAERMQKNALPVVAPLLDGWELAGWTAQAEGVGGAFHDWFGLPDGLLAVAVGRAAESGIAGALTAKAAKTAFRAHARYQRQAEQILQQVNMTLWTGSAGDQRADLFCGLVETATGRVSCATAGGASVLLLHGNGWKSLSHHAVGLGESPEAVFEPCGHELLPGEALVIFTDSVREARNAKGRALGESGLARALRGKLDWTADELAAIAREALETHLGGSIHPDQSLLVVKRSGS